MAAQSSVRAPMAPVAALMTPMAPEQVAFLAFLSVCARLVVQLPSSVVPFFWFGWFWFFGLRLGFWFWFFGLLCVQLFRYLWCLWYFWRWCDVLLDGLDGNVFSHFI